MPAVPDRLKGKVSVVSGGGNGIGTGICERLASEGSLVWVLDIDASAARQVAADIKGKGFEAEAAVVSKGCLFCQPGADGVYEWTILQTLASLQRACKTTVAFQCRFSAEPLNHGCRKILGLYI